MSKTQLPPIDPNLDAKIIIIRQRLDVIRKKHQAGGTQLAADMQRNRAAILNIHAGTKTPDNLLRIVTQVTREINNRMAEKGRIVFR